MSSARKGCGDTADAFKAIGVEVVDASGKLRKADVVFLEAIDRLSRMEDGTERDALAMSIFGKSAQELNPLIIAGSAGIEEYTRKAHELGVVVSDETVGALAEVQDGVKDVTFQFGAAKQELAAEFAPVAKDVLNALSDLIKQGKDQLKDPQIKKSVKDLGDSLGKLTKSGSELAVKVLPKLADALKFIAEHGKGVAIALAAVWAVLKGLSVVTKAVKAYNELSTALKALKTTAEAAQAAEEGLAAASTASAVSTAAAATAIIAVVAALGAFVAWCVKDSRERYEQLVADSIEINEKVNSLVEELNNVQIAT